MASSNLLVTVFLICLYIIGITDAQTEDTAGGDVYEDLPLGSLDNTDDPLDYTDYGDYENENRIQETGSDEGLVIPTEGGKIRGFRKFATGDLFTTRFRGIPYAKAPLNRLRFLPPQSHAGWGDEIRDATSYAPSCPQNDLYWRQLLGDWVYEKYMRGAQYSEDCLYLNVYVPGQVVPDANLPVMVFIHGGSFLTGGSSFRLFEGDWLSLTGGVIVVSINYRLGKTNVHRSIDISYDIM